MSTDDIHEGVDPDDNGSGLTDEEWAAMAAHIRDETLPRMSFRHMRLSLVRGGRDD